MASDDRKPESVRTQSGIRPGIFQTQYSRVATASLALPFFSSSPPISRRRKRPRCSLTGADLATMHRWLTVRCGTWALPIRELSPLVLLSAGLPTAGQAAPTATGSAPTQTLTFTLPGSFDAGRNIVAVAGVVMTPVSAGWEVGADWPGRSVYMTVNGAAVPSLEPSTAGGTLNVAQHCRSGNNIMSLFATCADTVGVQVRLCSSLGGQSLPAFLRLVVGRVSHRACVLTYLQAAGSDLGSNALHFQGQDMARAAQRGQLSAVQAAIDSAAAAGKIRPTPAAEGAGDEGEGDGVIATAARVLSLVDPVGGQQLTLPVRGVHCTHTSCTNLASLLAITRQRSGGAMVCPICSSRLHWGEVSLDTAMLALLQAVAEGENTGMFSALPKRVVATKWGGPEELWPSAVELRCNGVWTVLGADVVDTPAGPAVAAHPGDVNVDIGEDTGVIGVAHGDSQAPAGDQAV